MIFVDAENKLKYDTDSMELISDNISYETVKLNYIDLVRSILR